MVGRAYEARVTKKKRGSAWSLFDARRTKPAQALSDVRQKILRRPIAMPVWLLRPGSSTFAAPFVLLKSTVP
ncbi:hypothetical protein D5R55_16610 [Burkholderia cenocepacia]|uniref:Uncharacterized protein n=1 Tax=Burkholderia cenocepacia TaxID=95486 RepID=A0A3Q9FAN2_9BURK|nr:hypothetical protein D5R55_16610 [Burkholderia cenocepacia]